MVLPAFATTAPAHTLLDEELGKAAQSDCLVLCGHLSLACWGRQRNPHARLRGETKTTVEVSQRKLNRKGRTG